MFFPSSYVSVLQISVGKIQCQRQVNSAYRSHEISANLMQFLTSICPQREKNVYRIMMHTETIQTPNKSLLSNWNMLQWTSVSHKIFKDLKIKKLSTIQDRRQLKGTQNILSTDLLQLFKMFPQELHRTLRLCNAEVDNALFQDLLDVVLLDEYFTALQTLVFFQSGGGGGHLIFYLCGGGRKKGGP